MFSLLISSLLFELASIYTLNKHKKVSIALQALTILFSVFPTTSLIILQPSLASSLLVCATIVRVITILRIAEQRMGIKELISRSVRSYYSTTIATVLLVLYMSTIDDAFAVSIYILLYTQLIFALILTLSVFISRYIYRYRDSKHSDAKLPTVSVCVPARNETQDLPACIESIIASTYPKLEIVVLDDCSHDKTPEIIKRYAHAGVRFINGKEPNDDWLAKNAAYDRLADEARGDILLFIGVDVRLSPNSISEVVSQLNHDDMISILPKRSAQHESAFFIQPIRYWWELGLWRFITKKPPVLSTCWAIRAKTLKKLGTFESVKKAVNPEAVFAQQLKAKSQYAFLIANNTVGVISVKSPHDQYKTALRKRYTQVKRRPESAMVTLLLELFGFVLPIPVAIWFAINGYYVPLIIALLPIFLIGIATAEIYRLSLNKLWPLGFLTAPLLVIVDSYLLAKSLHSYEFDKVIWKERNICLPLLTVEKSLPKL